MRLIAEIKYRDGVVYLDRCGTLSLRLGRTVGEVFRLSLPNMDHGEFSNHVERMTLTFGLQALRVDQFGPETVARVEKVIGDAWKDVAEVLDVGGKVTRFAVRAYATWPFAEKEEARQALRDSGLIHPSPAWAETLPGGSDWGSVIAYTKGDRGGHTRREVDSVAHQDAAFVEGYREYFPKHCVQFNADYCYLDKPEGATLKVDAVRAFVRECWGRFVEETRAVQTRLGVADA